MKILMVTGRLPSSINPGTQSFITRQIDSLRPYCSKIDIHEVVGNKFFKHFKSAKYTFEVASNYDIIHVHYGLFAISTLIGRRKTPVILSLMGHDLLGTENEKGKITFITGIEAFVTKFILKFCKSIIVKSQAMADVIPNLRTKVIPNGVDLSLFKPQKISIAREKLKWDLNKYYLLFPGNPKRPEKNWQLAVDAIKVAQQNVENEICLIPLLNVPPDDVPSYINASNFVLMTSFSEGSPNVVKEALACNKSVVSVKVGDVVRTIGGLKGCSLVEYDANLIGKEIVKRIENGGNVTEGRNRLNELSLDLDSVAKKIMQIYSNALS